MPGEWNFVFKYDEKESLDLEKYQQSLIKIREEFEPKFAAMNPAEGTAVWTSEPKHNVFGKFTYNCCTPHSYQGPEHGTWILLWDPKKADVKSHLLAQCASTMFYQLSTQIQMKLKAEFPAVLELTCDNEHIGHEKAVGGGPEDLLLGGVEFMNEHKAHCRARRLELWDSDSDCCEHGLAWGRCDECTDDLLDAFGGYH